jgi:hypothetical protein
MLKTIVFSALFLFGWAQAAWAADAPSKLPLRPDWSKQVETDLVLWQALDAAYPEAKVDPDQESSRVACLFPYKLLSYDKFWVLITLAGEPGEACHGCSAKVSAVFLRRDGNKLKPSSRHNVFEEIGTLGDLTSLNSFRLGTEVGLAIEGGGTFQGYSTGVLSPFLIRNGRIKAIGPKNGISSWDSDCGVRGEPCREVDSQWHSDGQRLIIRYTGARKDGTKIDGNVVYALRKGSLVRISGHRLAREMEERRP